MQGTISLDRILRLLTPLSSSNKKWLADRLYEQVEKPERLVFPKLPKDFKVSKDVEELTFGPLPEGVDLDKEMDEMWKELAR